MTSMGIGTLSDPERATAAASLERSLQHFERVMDSVPDRLFCCTPLPGGWSPAEAAEHIVVTEQSILPLLKTKLPQSPERPVTEEIRRQDEYIAARVVRRSGRRVEAPEFIRPTGRWRTKGESIGALRTVRAATVEFALSTDLPLRVHTLPHLAFGPIDGYQWLLFLAGHCVRHTLQIEEALAGLNSRLTAEVPGG